MLKNAAFIIILIVMSLTLMSCGGLRNQSYIHATDYITGENLSIKLKVKRASSAGQTYFSIDKNLADLAEELVEADSSLSVEISQEDLILIDTGTDYFSIIEVEKINEDKENEHRYLFFATMRQDINKAAGYSM